MLGYCASRKLVSSLPISCKTSCKSLAEMETRHAEALGAEEERVDAAWALLRGLERVWSDDIRFG